MFVYLFSEFPEYVNKPKIIKYKRLFNFYKLFILHNYYFLFFHSFQVFLWVLNNLIVHVSNIIPNYWRKLQLKIGKLEFLAIYVFRRSGSIVVYKQNGSVLSRDWEKTNYSTLNIASFFIDQQQEFNISLIPEFLFHHLPLAKLPLLPIFFSVQATRKTKFIRKLGFFSECEKLLPSSTTNAPRLKNHL